MEKKVISTEGDNFITNDEKYAIIFNNFFNTVINGLRT